MRKVWKRLIKINVNHVDLTSLHCSQYIYRKDAVPEKGLFCLFYQDKSDKFSSPRLHLVHVCYYNWTVLLCKSCITKM